MGWHLAERMRAGGAGTACTASEKERKKEKEEVGEGAWGGRARLISCFVDMTMFATWLGVGRFRCFTFLSWTAPSVSRGQYSFSAREAALCLPRLRSCQLHQAEKEISWLVMRHASPRGGRREEVLVASAVLVWVECGQISSESAVLSHQNLAESRERSCMRYQQRSRTMRCDTDAR